MIVPTVWPIEWIRYEDFARNTKASVLAELQEKSLAILNWRPESWVG